MNRVAVLLLLVAACGTPTDLPTAPSDGWQNVEHSNGSIMEIRLRDGTQCVVTDRGGISCDWGER